MGFIPSPSCRRRLRFKAQLSHQIEYIEVDPKSCEPVMRQPSMCDLRHGAAQRFASNPAYAVVRRLLKKLQITVFAFGSPGTGSKLDPNHVWWPPTTLSSLTTAPPWHS